MEYTIEVEARVRCVCGRVHKCAQGDSHQCNCGAVVYVDINSDGKWQPHVMFPDASYLGRSQKYNHPEIMGFARAK